MLSKKQPETPGRRQSQSAAPNALTYQDLYKRSEDYLKELLKDNLPADSKVFLFGSRAKGDQSKSSDIDIGVISGKLNRKLIIKLKEIISESFVPFNVDIVDFSKVDEDFKKEALRSIIEWK